MYDIEKIFNDRTCSKFLNTPIEQTLLKKIYDTMKLGPTSANSCPLRIVFVQSHLEREKLYKCLHAGNIEKTKTAPVTAVFAYDTEFYKLMSKLYPINPEIGAYFATETIAKNVAQQNSTLQAAYFMIIARAHGLSCGPMGGFDENAVNNSFFANGKYKVSFLCNLGYAPSEESYPRLPRLTFDESCKIV